MIVQQLFRFGLVGMLATVLHMIVGATLIHASWPPLLANLVSFLIAFLVSFMGHYGFSFPDHTQSLGTSLGRFVLVASGGFIVNETLLAGLLHFSPLAPVWCLVVSTATAAVVTFTASRNWAFHNARRAVAVRRTNVAKTSGRSDMTN